MRYQDFDRIVSQQRMSRYVQACGGDTRKAMTLYHVNKFLSWMGFDGGKLVARENRVEKICREIERIRATIIKQAPPA